MRRRCAQVVARRVALDLPRIQFGIALYFGFFEQADAPFEALEALGFRQSAEADQDMLRALTENLANAPLWPH